MIPEQSGTLVCLVLLPAPWIQQEAAEWRIRVPRRVEGKRHRIVLVKIRDDGSSHPLPSMEARLHQREVVHVDSVECPQLTREQVYRASPMSVVEPEQWEVGDVPIPARAFRLGRHRVHDQIPERLGELDRVSVVALTQEMHVVTRPEEGGGFVLDTDVRWEALLEQHEDPHAYRLLPRPMCDPRAVRTGAS